MTGNYYYLVSGLPDLLLDQSGRPCTCKDFIGEALSLLSNKDGARFNRLRYPFDNCNLLNMIEKRDEPFDERGSIEETDLVNGLKLADNLPEYMQQFLEAWRNNRFSHRCNTLADQLAWYFYEAMMSDENEFVREYCTFDCNLRNLAAAINCRKGLGHIDALTTDHDRPIAALVVGYGDMAELLRKSTAPDFGVATLFPAVETVLAMSKNTLLEFEKGLDTLRWDRANELASAQLFKAETVFAFFIKLTIVERWQALDEQSGKERLDRLIGELTASYSMPESF
jgi:hypothetical protein